MARALRSNRARWFPEAHADLAPRKIRVNSVHPGPIDTEMLKVRTAEQNRQRLQLVPMKRMGTAEEVASLALFLLSDCDSALIPALQRKASRIGYRPAEASSKPRGGDPG